jgi:uncharacterized protein YjaZ
MIKLFVEILIFISKPLVSCYTFEQKTTWHRKEKQNMNCKKKIKTWNSLNVSLGITSGSPPLSTP